jgi:hypothetical protein
VGGEQWKAVCETLNGAGVSSMQAKFDEMFLPKAVEVTEKIKAKKKPAMKKPVGKSAAKKTPDKKAKPAVKKKRSTKSEK